MYRARSTRMSGFRRGATSLRLWALASLAASSLSLFPGNAAASPSASKWDLPGLDGRTVHSTDYQGKTVLLVFWSTWCPDCHLEISTLNSLQAALANRPFSIVGVCVDSGDRDTVRKFTSSHNVKYPVVLGDDMMKLSYGGIKSLPTAFVIGPDGTIVQSFTDSSQMTQANFEQAVAPVLGPKGAVAVTTTPASGPPADAPSDTAAAAPVPAVESPPIAAAAPAPSAPSSGGFSTQFDGGPVTLKNRSRMEDYDFSLSDEKYYLYVPKDYDGSSPFGLLAFISAGASVTVPTAWEAELDRRHLIYIAAQNVGNDQRMQRRAAVTMAGVYRAMADYKIDPSRVYVSGISGGARMSVIVAFHHPEVFAGVIPICGADYYRAVPRVAATKDDAYGVNSYDIQAVQRARQTERLALITGEKDWRRGNILDIYKGAYVKDGFHVKLWDVPGMGHEVCSAEILDQALDFIEGKSKDTETAAAAP